MHSQVTQAWMVAAVILCLVAGTADGHEMHKHPAAAPATEARHERQSKATGPVLRTDESYQRKYFTDLPLLTQDGKEVRFYTDMLRGKVVLISFIYTNCTDICPILMPNLAEIQNQLGDRFGREVTFVSISVDPEDDTPEELKKYGEKYGARPGWTFLTSWGNTRKTSRTTRCCSCSATYGTPAGRKCGATCLRKSSWPASSSFWRGDEKETPKSPSPVYLSGKPFPAFRAPPPPNG